MMDAIFASSEDDNRGRLLKIMQDFLVSESVKHSAEQKGMFTEIQKGDIHLLPCSVSSASNTANSTASVNMEELVGNTHGFAESGYVPLDLFYTSDLSVKTFLVSFSVSALL